MFDVEPIQNTKEYRVPQPFVFDPEAIKKTAKLRADMKAAIAAAPTYNIRSQLRYRLRNEVYEYVDLIDPKVVEEYINKPIPEPVTIIPGQPVAPIGTYAKPFFVADKSNSPIV